MEKPREAPSHVSDRVMGISDNGIAAKAVRGDRRALAEIVRGSYRTVWGTLYRFTRNRDEADGLAQEAFLRAIRNLGSFRGESRLTTWIVRIALNLALNERRKKTPGSLPDFELSSSAPGPDREAEQNEVRERVRDAIAALPDDLSRALLMTFFGGVSHAEAAGVLGCAEGTISWRVHEAKKRLREVLPHEL